MLSFSTIHDCAIRAGFDDCGAAPARRQDSDAAYMEQWVAQGLHGEMSYFERNREKRYNPCEIVEGAETVVVCVLRYDKCKRDYHRTIKSMLYELDAMLYPAAEDRTQAQHIFCDSAPFLERRWAVEAGLGFIGRNHQFFHRTLGSMVHLGELVLREPVDGIPAPEPCEGCPPDCRRCMEACPTGALRNAVWDARQCIAYTTHRCLVCQQACPLNAAASSLPADDNGR